MKYWVIFLILILELLVTPLTYAQTIVVPTTYCLGSCPQIENANTPSGTKTPPQTQQGVSKPITNPQTAGNTGSTPCVSQTSTQNIQTEGVYHRRGSMQRGFLQDFLSFFFQLIELLFQLLGGGNLSQLPCVPSIAGGNPVPSLTSPSVIPSTAVPSSGTVPSLLPSTAPSQAVVPSVAPTTVVTPIIAQPTPIPFDSSAVNWAGYVSQTAIPVNGKVTANWILSTINCSGSNGIISPWPGMGGYGGDPNIAQLGNDMDCSTGSANYTTWSEAFPAGSVYYANDPASAGDQMTASVTYTGNGAFSTTMTNATKGWTINVPMSFSNYQPQVSEVILEVLGSGSVPNFAPQAFTNMTYSNGSSQMPYGSAPGLRGMNGGSNGVLKFKTGPLTGDTFTETFVSN